MTPELQQKLYDKYPEIFVQKDQSMRQTCMCWGIEVGNGWYNILDALCANIMGHAMNQRKDIEMYRRFRDGKELQMIFGIRAKAQGIASARAWFKSFLPYLKDQRTPQEIVPCIQAVQVKEKFGSLRFYTDTSDDYVEGLISMADSMSARTCEICGKPGHVLNHGGWLSARCEGCTEKRVWEVKTPEVPQLTP